MGPLKHVVNIHEFEQWKERSVVKQKNSISASSHHAIRCGEYLAPCISKGDRSMQNFEEVINETRSRNLHNFKYRQHVGVGGEKRQLDIALSIVREFGVVQWNYST